MPSAPVLTLADGTYLLVRKTESGMQFESSLVPKRELTGWHCLMSSGIGRVAATTISYGSMDM